MNEFGKLLRNFRESCRDSHFPARRITQERFGELLGMELGTHGYSGAAVSDWERGASKIHADQRSVLISIVKILHRQGGIKSPEEASQLLEAGNYRALNLDEARGIFQESAFDVPVQPTSAETMESRIGYLNFIGTIFFESPREFQSILTKAGEGPPPAWPRVMVSIFRRYSDHLSASSALTFILWVWVWLLAWALIAPSLRWPFPSRDAALTAIVLYATGAIIIPAFIGAMTNTKDNEFWKGKESARGLNLRFYTHQGASMGFHVGYFFVFMIDLLFYNLGITRALWLELAGMALPVFLGSASARLVPYNLLIAYKRLSLGDGAIFFVFFLFGPAWAYFFLESYDVLLTQALGAFVFLLAITIIVGQAVWQSREQTKPPKR